MNWMDPPDGRPWALIGLCGASLLLNVALLAAIVFDGDESAPETAEEIVFAEPTAADAVAAAVVIEPPPAPVLPENMHVVRAAVDQSLARTFQVADPERADVISAIYARLFFWDLDLRRDLQIGDQVAVAYEWDGELAYIPVASYESKKLGRTLTAYRFQATGDAFPSWWTADGEEVPRRLEESPLASFEQVTSLIKDRPTHKGMDFKVPVGTDVVSPMAGTVVRADWNFTYNGNCVEVRYADGTLARFLHLSRTDVGAGQKVAAGQTIGLSGNTGRSTAPHLHYELEKAGRVVDPVDYHGIVRRSLPEADRVAFEAEKARLDALLATQI